MPIPTISVVVASRIKFVGIQLQPPPDEPPPPEKPKTILAALGPRMIELARTHADGIHPYNVSPDHTAMAREILGPGKLLCPEQMVILETEPSRARAIARRM